ncbi:MAG: prolipoprotein diacylglyceryl transferase [Planctomyces sp.]|nr:prolipoprotein diacylglyceryl transferase [Planctomyces sp.]
MRQVLFHISLARPWAFWTHVPDHIWPEVGIVWAWLLLFGLWGVWELASHRERLTRGVVLQTLGWWLAGIPLAYVIPLFVPAKSFPVFGYGVMVAIGFSLAVVDARRRASRQGIDPDRISEGAIWLLFGGVIGGRLFYLLQYHAQVYEKVESFKDLLTATINLSAGGLVLIGALVGGGLGFVGFCLFRRQPILNLFDIITPSIFIGIGFGRIGCLLNGCCFGDRCTLPWGISFPEKSVPFEALSRRGFLPPDAPSTMPLHPTQIYSSLDGFLLAFVTAVLFTERRWPGEVFATGCVLYAITRFLVEFLRGDEIGQLGTGLTISQLYSIAIVVLGGSILIWHARRGRSGADGLRRQ